MNDKQKLSQYIKQHENALIFLFGPALVSSVRTYLVEVDKHTCALAVSV